MRVQKISPISVEKVGVKSLLSDEYMLAFFKKFCDEIKSQMWGWKKAKNARYNAEDFLRVFFIPK